MADRCQTGMRHAPAPCNECPWRVDNIDNPASQFPAERWEDLAVTVPDPDTGRHPGFNDIMFGCHKGTPGQPDTDLACAGWLATYGTAHVNVRLALATGALPATALTPGPNWPELHQTWADVVANQTAEED